MWKLAAYKSFKSGYCLPIPMPKHQTNTVRRFFRPAGAELEFRVRLYTRGTPGDFDDAVFYTRV